jgi:O-antigen biosynthesis protein
VGNSLPFNSQLAAKRFYFVQDFEPYFYPIGSEYVLAENTYRFGFYGTTAGGWLAQKLRKDYGMQTDHFDFGADFSLYQHTNQTKRKEVLFYVRPVTARRGFELGIMALELFHKQHPEYTINLVGWDVSSYAIPFPHNNLGTLDVAQLSKLYNRCAVGLVMSLTNMSLLPIEMLACGVIPIVNDGDNNRLVSSNPFIAYAENNPMALAHKMSETIDRTDLIAYSAEASRSVSSLGWEKAGNHFVKIIERETYNA